jgi:tetratricopeptide (TPR) repeat protein
MFRSCVILVCALEFLVPIVAFSDSPAPPPPSDAAQVLTPYHTEQEWIISSICRNAFELLAYAKDKKGESVSPDKVTVTLIPGDTLAYDVTLKGANVTVQAKLQWPDSLWSPAAYVPFCQAAAQVLKLPPAAVPQPQGNPLHTLLDFTETAIEGENHRVSQWLATQPDDAAAQEQAALILGTLAMKENSGYFWDPREACNQVCAHLAVAQFLRAGSPVSIEGRLADCLVGLIADTKTQTGHDLDQLAAEKPPPPDLAAWLNACRMRNTRDWRIVANPEKASPLEQVEYFRAYAEGVNPDLAIAWLQAHSMANRVDWQRIVLEMGFSVQAGHIFAQSSIPQEIHVMQTTFPGSFDSTSLIADLNEPPGDAVNFSGASVGTPVVISRGLWAQFFQRHLCHAIAETGNFFANKWGVPDNTNALDQAVNKAFPTLTLFPYLQLVQQHMRGAPASPVPALAMFTARPESGPDFLAWMKLPPDPEASRLANAVNAWFTPPVVHGTAYGAMSRLAAANWPDAQIDQFYAIAPLQIRVAQLELKRLYGTQFTYDQFQKVMGPLLDYDVQALDQAKGAVGLTFDERIEIAEKSASINPDNLFDLARLYQDSHQDDKAAATYQEWFDKGLDRVEISNEMDWLVNYYFDHGQPDKALAIAQDGAEVYSARGLETMMHLQERMGNLAEAESYGQKVQERYKDNSALAQFYQRHAANAGYQAKFDQLASTVFPDGMKKVALAGLSGPPSVGITFAQTNDAMRAFGLSSDQVVIALDGYAVQTEAQYVFVRALSDSPAMHFIVWDGHAYREIDGNRPGRRFGVDLKEYHP